ncbi:MAG TPA: arabinofuranosidase catalytic domain-containing protein [Anaerolineae bacterium]|nr:arabinofuranosidase catalytic domain-containing protein [Anaerolineae bacterium]
MPLSMRAGAPGGFAPAYDGIPNIVHIYEPARRVLTSYTGNLVRLRRASDNAEANFTYLANGDLNVAAITAWAGGASYVVTVYDQAPASDDVTQAVAANQPLYVANARNGHAGMRFDGTNHALAGTYTTGGQLSQPFTVFAIGALDAVAVNDGALYALCDGIDGNRMLMFQYNAPTPDGWALYAGAYLVGSSSDSNWNVWAMLFNGVSSQFWINATSEASGDAGAQNAKGLRIGASNLAGAEWDGDIVSVVICDPSLSDAQRVAAMQNAMNSYWGCY